MQAEMLVEESFWKVVWRAQATTGKWQGFPQMHQTAVFTCRIVPSHFPCSALAAHGGPTCESILRKLSAKNTCCGQPEPLEQAIQEGCECYPNSDLPEPFNGLSDQQLLERWPNEFRFRDPGFVKIWIRWQQARATWRKAWWSCPLGTLWDFPDAECPEHPDAREFVAARRAYLEDLERRRTLESPEV